MSQDANEKDSTYWREEINCLAAKFNFTPEGNEPECFAQALSLCEKMLRHIKADEECGTYSREIQRCFSFIPQRFFSNDQWENAVKRMADSLEEKEKELADYGRRAIENDALMRKRCYEAEAALESERKRNDLLSKHLYDTHHCNCDFESPAAPEQKESENNV